MSKVIFYSFFLFFISFYSFGNGNDTSNSIKIYKIIDNNEYPYDTFDGLEKSIEKLLSHYNITGASFAISKAGRMVYAQGFGFADKENEITVLPQHQFRIASVSKLITAVAIFKLIENGKISLDQQVFGKNGILDKAIYNIHIYDTRIKNITLRHLLTHSAGWDYSDKTDPMFNPRLMTRGNDYLVDPNLTNLISHALSQGLDANPGEESHYFNLGYCMLGEIIETVTLMPYEKYVEEEILLPLEITSFSLGKNLKKDKLPNEVLYYDHYLRNSFSGNGKLVPRPYGGTPIELLGPSGGWIASTMDLVKLVNAIDGDESIPDILNEESIATMTAYTGLLPMGWINCGKDSDWIRTGTLAGSHALVVKKNNDIRYALVINSSSGMNHTFSKKMYAYIEAGLQTIKYWPDYDLFQGLEKNYQLVEKTNFLHPVEHKLFADVPIPATKQLLTKKD